MILTRVLIIFLIFNLILSCDSRETELTINDELQIETRESENYAENQGNTISNENSQTRPLIEIEKSDELQIYVRADGAPGMYLDTDGQLKGFYVALEKMLMEEMGQSYKLIPYNNVGPLVQLMKTGEAHSALAVPDLADYRAIASLSDSFEVLEYVTFVKKGNTSISGITSAEILSSLAGKKVGVQTRGHIYQVLRDYKEIELVEYPTTTTALNDLNDGKLDAVPDVRRIGLYYSELNNWDIVPIGIPIITQNLTTGFSQALDPSVIERYNRALNTIKADGRLEALFIEYFGN